jgi:hypothetical protein
MNLEEIQTYVASLLTAAPALAGVPVQLEDGSYPRTPEREQALATAGLVLTVWEVESGGVADMTPDGTVFHLAVARVVIDENQEVCRNGGVNIRAEKAVRLVMETLTGADPGGAGRHPFLPLDPPFQGFGKIDGVNRWVVSFAKLIETKPTR